MIDTQLICYKHYFLWADELISDGDAPPEWILELSTIKYYPHAVQALNRYVYSEPFEAFDGVEAADERVACLYLRYRIGAISWATFLWESGEYVDGYDGRRSCEYFYSRLTELEDREYSQAIEATQRTEVEVEFSAAFSTIRPLFDMFMEYHRRYVAQGTAT